MLFDTHTHINVDDFDVDRAEVIARAREAGVAGFAIVGFNKHTIKAARKLAKTNADMVSVLGWHPTEAKDFTDAHEAYLLKHLDNKRVVALGETGLDYYWDTSSPRDQERALRRQLAIAREFKLPVVIHNREATADVYKILKDENVGQIGGIMHSFGEGPEWAKKFLDLGMHLSFSGVSTFKKTDDVREAAQLVPDDKILIETDAPYLAPVPKRGKRNEPAYVHYVCERLSEVRETSYTDFAELTFKNALNLFKLKHDDQDGLKRLD
ncbi:hydrolase TatD [Aerococcus urinaehominis]|uniref:Hydrolase TatD n=1 Tax=Aerococcus urinaehominis TaxID=128944 RepID=A0A0X8FLJ6_9LACT|nr:TatD family hydrolase [Aerococcus urinaehominis]AMB99541.1 hydrolase TatD [Aerococcus urinaehominis]SDM34463.1 TatD DNase family protein [Aerococcus urinaehominis]